MSVVPVLPAAEAADPMPKAEPMAAISWTTKAPTLGMAIEIAVATEPTAITVDPALDIKLGLRLSNSYRLFVISCPPVVTQLSNNR